MSIGGEFGWGIGLANTGKTKTTYEGVGNNGSAAQNSTGSVTIENSKTGTWWLDTDGKNSVWGPTGKLRLNLYF